MRFLRTGGRGLVLAAVLAVAACATPAEMENMVAVPAATDAPLPAALHAAMCVRHVTGGQDTNPLLMSQVDAAHFGAAIRVSLQAQALLAEGNCAYPIDADLVALVQPVMGFDMRVGSIVAWRVDAADGRVLLRETVSAGYTAAFSESVVGMVRLKRANEGAMRENIRQFIDRLPELKL